MRIVFVALLALIWTVSAFAQTSLGFLDVGLGVACCMAIDSSGNTFVAGWSNPSDPTKPGSPVEGIVVAKFDRDLKQVYRFAFGGTGYYAVKAIAVDGQGNVFIAGQTASSEFPLVHPLVSTVTKNGTGFVIKVNPAGDQLIFSTLMGGTNPDSITDVNAMSADAKGDVYLTGFTTAGDFPVTSNAYQRSGPVAGASGAPEYAFVTKLTNGGERILYSTFLGDGAGPCAVGGPCPGVGYTVGRAIAVAADGAVTIAGSTSAPKYPVTPGAFQSDCRCNHPSSSTGFVSRLTADGAALQWSTFLGGSGNPNQNGNLGDQLWRLALASNGDAVVAGFATSPDFPVTPGAFQSQLVGINPSRNPNGENAVIARINSTGTKLVFSTYFGGSGNTAIFSLQLDADDNSWVAGYDPALDFAVLPGSLRLGQGFFSELSSDGSKLLKSERLPDALSGALAPGVSGGQIIISLHEGSILRLPSGGAPNLIVTGLSNAAGATNAKVAPGEIVSFYGVGLGPSEGVGAQFDGAGKISTNLAGTQVLFDGTPAPLLYVGGGQVNAIVPFGVSTKVSTFVELRTAGGVQSTVAVGVVPADPQIFSDAFGYALALNQDGSLNSIANPASRGSVITFWVSGGGVFPSLTDGSIVQPPFPVPVLPVSVMFDFTEAGEVLYAGAAPGLVAGVLQVNVRIPTLKFAPGNLEVSVGGFKGGAGIAVR